MQNFCRRQINLEGQALQQLGYIESDYSRAYLSQIYVKSSKQVRYNIYSMEQEEGERRDQRKDQQVWKDYVSDQLGWLNHFYSTAGEKGNEAFKKAEDAFKDLEKKLSSSHYNKNGNYFKTFAKLQKNKYYRMMPYSIKDLLKGKVASSILSSHASGLVKQSKERIYFESLYENFKNIIHYLTLERYNLTNIAKHIFRTKFEVDDHGEQIECFTFDVERGNLVKWKEHASEVLFYVFLKSVSKGIMELQAKGIFHLDLILRNILLFGCQNISDLSDPLKIANNEELMFKIIDFDNALLVGKANIEKTLQIFELRQRIKKQGLYEPYFKVDFQKLNNDAIRYMEKEHAQQFATCFDDIMKENKINLPSQEEELLRNMIPNRRYEDLIKKMDEKIKNIKSQNGQR